MTVILEDLETYVVECLLEEFLTFLLADVDLARSAGHLYSGT